MNYQNNIDAYYAYAKENHKRRRKEKRAIWLWLIATIMVLFGVWAYLSNLNLPNLLTSEDNSSKDTPSETILADDSSRENARSKSINVSKNNDFPRDIKMNKEKEENEKRGKNPYSFASKENSKSQSVALEKVTKENIKDANAMGLVKKEIAKNDNSMGLIKKENIKDANAMGLVKKEIVKNNNSIEFQKDTEKNSTDDKKPSMLAKSSSDMNISLKKDFNASFAQLKDTDTNSSIEKNTSLLKVATLEQNSSLKQENLVDENVSVELYHVYIVSKGETIYDIARKEYGDTQMYIEIVNANQDLENPNKIREGQELFLPIVNESKSYSEILHFK